MPINCIACQSLDTILLDINYKHGVTSDCQPVDYSPRFLVCNECSLIQKEVTQEYRNLINDIYSNYDIYHNANGEEQAVFSDIGVSTPRSHEVLNFLLNEGPDKKIGTLLEIGCGNGSNLKTFSELKPDWELVGTEFDARHQVKIEKIKNTSFFLGNFIEINKKFDLIVCYHVLEHIDDPQEFLVNCASKLSIDGRMLIQVPDIEKNSFDLFVADHCSHFSLESLNKLAIKSNLKILKSKNVIKKEISLILEKTDNNKYTQLVSSYFRNFELLASKIEGLSLDKNPNLGIFGSSIAATLLFSRFRDKIKFFVDEDPYKVGNQHFNIPIISTEKIPADSIVIIPMNIEQAISIEDRLKNDSFNFLY
jgi:2-polyprenyl-3-methyl-5-hydroxy-6-metoxy-1,4-benzoquinol methylase